MSRATKRIHFSTTVHPDSYTAIEALAEDAQIPFSRAIDVAMKEWMELNSAKAFRERKQAESLEEVKARVHKLEGMINSLNTTVKAILHYHQAMHPLEKTSDPLFQKDLA